MVLPDIRCVPAGPSVHAASGPSRRKGWGTQALLWLGLLGLPALSPLFAAEPAPATAQPREHDVPGIREAQLSADHWIKRARNVERVIFDGDGVATQNAVMQRLDGSIHDLDALPVTLEAEQVRSWIDAVSSRPTRTLYDESGKEGTIRAIDKLINALDLRNLPQTQVTRFGMVVHRADLRAFPTHLRVFSAPGDNDIDRFQESALFPGTAVAVVHESRDRNWFFVVSQTYAAWIEKKHVAIGDREAVLGYARKTPFLVVTGATARTVFNPEQPDVSEVQLDMGVRVPLADWPADQPLHGQHSYAGHAVVLPTRQKDGSLAFVPALIPRSADVNRGYLPMTREHLLRQAFKFLGERYGWGHAYNARDCSGFVSEIYRSFGIVLPRNTSAQAVSPALNRIVVDENTSHQQRLKLLRDTQVGDLIYIPGHVMMVVGQENGDTYVIHDTAGMNYRNQAGEFKRLALNGVVVTPVLPMLASADQQTVDRITSIQRIRP